jgi:hypothetical protein
MVMVNYGQEIHKERIMSLLIGAFGFIIGLFLWSNVFGTLFGTYPVEKKMVENGISIKINWGMIVGTLAFAIAVLALTAIFARTFFYGTLAAAVVMLFNIPKLKSEAYDNFMNDLAQKHETQADK